MELAGPAVGKVDGVNEGESTLKVPLEVAFLTLHEDVSILEIGLFITAEIMTCSVDQIFALQSRREILQYDTNTRPA